MAFQVSPGVQVKEIDATNVVPAISTTIGGFVGVFNWGPVEEICTVNTEKELAEKFFTPDSIAADAQFNVPKMLFLTPSVLFNSTIGTCLYAAA